MKKNIAYMDILHEKEFGCNNALVIPLDGDI